MAVHKDLTKFRELPSKYNFPSNQKRLLIPSFIPSSDGQSVQTVYDNVHCGDKILNFTHLVYLLFIQSLKAMPHAVIDNEELNNNHMTTADIIPNFLHGLLFTK